MAVRRLTLVGTEDGRQLHFVEKIELTPLSGLNGVTELNLSRTLVSDLSPLAGLSELTTLYLFGTPVSDLSPLAGLSGLTKLNLCGTRVSDLSPLEKLSNLKEVWLDKYQTVSIPQTLEKVIRRW